MNAIRTKNLHVDSDLHLRKFPLKGGVNRCITFSQLHFEYHFVEYYPMLFSFLFANTATNYIYFFHFIPFTLAYTAVCVWNIGWKFNVFAYILSVLWEFEDKFFSVLVPADTRLKRGNFWKSISYTEIAILFRACIYRASNTISVVVSIQ